MKELKRSQNKMISGVAAGIAEYLELDPTLVRIAFAVSGLITGGVMVLAYLVCLFIMPENK